MSHKESAKKSHMDKLARMCGGYTNKSSDGSAVKPKIVHRKRGGKVMKAEGGSAQTRLDKKPRKHRQFGGGSMLPLNADERMRMRMIQEAERMRKAAETAPSPYSAEDREKMNALIKSTTGREKGGKDGGKVTKGTYVGGHDSKADLIADKQLIKRAVAMHDAQEHKGESTDLSKLKKGGVIRKAAGGRLGFKPRKKKAGTTVNVIVAPNSGGAGMPSLAAPPPMLPPPTGAAPMAPPMASGMPPGMPSGMPGGMPGGIRPPMPPGLPMRKKGGRVEIKTGTKAEGMRNGTQVTHSPGKNDQMDIRKFRPITYKAGGSVYPKMKFGAGSGEGRLEKVEKYK
jgi:hypothetical protein